MLSKQVQDKITDLLNSTFNVPHTLHEFFPVSGGSINAAYKVMCDKGVFFVKVNSLEKYPLMFEAEVKGLELLRKTSTLFIPEVIGITSTASESIFVSRFVEQGAREKDFFYSFGAALAKMHGNTQNDFGLDHDNYIGSLHQSNKQHPGWNDFFIEERLEKQLKLAFDSHALSSSNAKTFQKLYARLEEIFPKEKPALLHGDLWSGNFMGSPSGTACIFDPAVYYGHREMDLAMTKLFGGFSPEFYAGYNSEYPLERKWEERVDICNLYPLLVHVNLFGGGYVGQVESILRPFK